MTTHFRIRYFGSLAVALASMMLMTDVSRAQRRGGQGQPRGQAEVWEFLAEKYDKDMDGELTEDEYDRGAETFARLDRNDDGVLTRADWDNVRGPFGAGEGQRPGDGLVGQAPEEGEQAPDFELPYVTEPTETIRLSSFAGKKPVALIFGSYT